MTTSTKGTRGVIVYSRDDAAQIFFPMGKKGMGRRTQFNTGGEAHHGYLRYGDVYNPLTGLETSPVQFPTISPIQQEQSIGLTRLRQMDI